MAMSGNLLKITNNNKKKWKLLIEKFYAKKVLIAIYIRVSKSTRKLDKDLV